MSRDVSVGLDGSPASSTAASWAAREPLPCEVPLIPVHAEEWPATAAGPMAGQEARRRWGEKVLATDAGLVVVGRRPRRAPLGAHIGSVAHAVTHHGAIPVAGVPRD